MSRWLTIACRTMSVLLALLAIALLGLGRAEGTADIAGVLVLMFGSLGWWLLASVRTDFFL